MAWQETTAYGRSRGTRGCRGRNGERVARARVRRTRVDFCAPAPSHARPAGDAHIRGAGPVGAAGLAVAGADAAGADAQRAAGPHAVGPFGPVGPDPVRAAGAYAVGAAGECPAGGRPAGGSAWRVELVVVRRVGSLVGLAGVARGRWRWRIIGVPGRARSARCVVALPAHARPRAASRPRASPAQRRAALPRLPRPAVV